MRIIESTNTRAIGALMNRRPARDREIDRRVSRIIQRVRLDGDKAVLRFAKQFDGLSEPVVVTREEMVRAQPMDAVVLIGGCDKTVPAQLMGAVSAKVKRRL